MMERAQNLDELKSKEKSTRNPDSLCLLPRSPWTRTTAPSSRKEKFLEASTIWNMDLTGEELVKVVGWSGMFSTEEVEEMVLQNFLFLQYEGEGRQHNTTLNIDFAFYSSTNLPFSWMNICNIFLFSICFLFNLTEWPHYEANIRSPFQALRLHLPRRGDRGAGESQQCSVTNTGYCLLQEKTVGHLSSTSAMRPDWEVEAFQLLFNWFLSCLLLNNIYFGEILKNNLKLRYKSTGRRGMRIAHRY